MPPVRATLNQRPLTALVALALAVCLPATGCRSAPSEDSGALARLDAAHRAELHAFEAEQARFLREAELATPRDFGPAGRLHLRAVELIGWPRAAYLRVEFTYVNSGQRTDRAPQVTLAVADPASGASESVTQDLVLPFGIELGSESTYSSWLELPVGDLYRRAGWQWDIRVEPRT